MSIYALLIGINEYAGNVPDLRGCHNDVERFAGVLKSRYGADNDHLQVLKSQQATKANIIDGFKQHLCKAGQDDIALVYYSGHGSQEWSPPEFWDIETDRQNETIVCHDSRAEIGASGDLADKELRFLIAELAKQSPQIVVIFDCCHSGSGTRGVANIDERAVRLTAPALQNRSIDQYIFYETAKTEGWDDDMHRLPSGQHVFISACHDSELSKELVIEGRRHGAFTHFLCKTLESSTADLSYRNLVSRVNQQVQGLVSKQHPQVEGIQGADVNEYFLGGEIQTIAFTVTRRGTQWWLDAGAIHGMHQGDRLAILEFPDQQQPLTEATIKSVEAEKSVLQMDTEPDTSAAYLAEVVLQSKPRLSIALDGDDQGVKLARDALQNMQGQGKPSRFLKEDPANAMYQVIAQDDRYSVTLMIDRTPLFTPEALGYSTISAKKALRKLEHMARWQHKLELDNRGNRPQQKIADNAVQLVIIHNGEETVDDDVTLSYEQLGNGWSAPEFSLEIRLNPELNHNKPLYCALLFFNPQDGSVQSAMDNGVWLRAEQSIDQDSGASHVVHASPVYKVFEGEAIEAFVDDRLYQRGITESQDILKLIVSETEFNASLLEQDGLEIYDSTLDPLDPINKHLVTRSGDALQSLLDEAMEYTNTRGIRKKPQAKLADWMSKAVTLATVRPLDGIEIPDEEVAELGFGIEVEPHPLRAVISVESQTQASRALEAVGKGYMATPQALQDNRITPPFLLSATRSAAADLSVVRLDLQEEATDRVSSEQPLVLSIDEPLAPGEQVLPFAFDGEFYYPLGHAEEVNGKTRIKVESLPDMQLVSEDTAAIMAKGLGNSIKLYFQKVFYDTLKLENETVRLAIPVFDPQSPTEVIDFEEDNAQIRTRIAQAERIVIFIHGIIGETRSMAGVVNHTLADGRKIKDDYDLILCFDYENLNTPIQETAQQFKQALQQAGLEAGHDKTVHIVAHSMGGLVSRWMIEQEGGNQLVSKLVMLGTPNKGSPWAGVKDAGVSMVKKWAYGSLTLILNGLTTVPVGGMAVAGMMKLIDSIDDTLDQMAENSDFTQALFNAPDPRLPYYLIAGNTEDLRIDVDTETGVPKVFKFAMQRSKLAAFDILSRTLFAEDNDVAVKLSSMKHIKADRSPPLQVNEVASDHMSYFVTPASVQALEQALRA